MSFLDPTQTKAVPDAQSRWAETRWGGLIQQLGQEVASPLGDALERIQHMVQTGKIDRRGLQALKADVRRAREAGRVGQQLGRLACGRLPVSHDTVNLQPLVKSVLDQRDAEYRAAGIVVTEHLQPLSVDSDGARLYDLLHTAMDWLLPRCRSHLEVRLEQDPMAGCARLHWTYAPQVGAEADASQGGPGAPIVWHLLDYTTRALGIPLQHQREGMRLRLTLSFEHLVAAPLLEPDSGLAPWDAPSSAHAKPLAGCQVLVVSANDSVRANIAAVGTAMGLIIDCVADMNEAQSFCADGLPHAIVYDAAQRQPPFDVLRHRLLSEASGLCFIEISDQDRPSQLSTAATDRIARLSSLRLADALPAMLLFELSRAL
ncbi:hypothetical protein ACG0Z6_07275 [Roseateles sp. BYS180W]|uniref:Uncharacterized protein n=1 Tax=Roseateles rivi TaxID=3299028 RepID=A0ABW7FUQ3_9BURK